MFKEFKKFILRGNVVDLAVAVMIGAAFNNVVQALVKDIITPLAAAISGNPDFSALSFTINNSKFGYGDFLNTLVSFLVVTVTVFFFVVTPINRLVSLRRKQPSEDPTTRKCPECLSEVPVEATRCAFCTQRLPKT